MDPTVNTLKLHLQVSQGLKWWKASYGDLTVGERHRNYCFELRKQIQKPVTALLAVGSQQESLKQLSALVSGEAFKAGHRTYSTSWHPQARNLCLENIAEEIVMQAEHVPADKAHLLPALAEALWHRFPDVGHLLLGHLLSRSPALMPAFLQPEVSGTAIDCIRLGVYRPMGTDLKRLPRVASLMRLYAAVLKAPLPPWHKDIAGGTPRQTLGPVLAWEWLEAWSQWPIDCPDMSAVLLCTFLEVAGGALSKNCAWRFHAMAHTLHRCYLPLLKEHARTARGAVGRLGIILEHVLKTGYFALPEVSTARF